jgi:phosphoribosyl 1,2-cyclic phosphodiesterase
MERMAIELKFWGVRGSTPTPVVENLGYGGNTTCMEITGAHGERIIFDAGSGIRELGLQISADKQLQELDIFLTHFHWDHIQGIPFFSPLMRPGNKIRFHSFPPVEEIQARLERQMSNPYFTLEFSKVGAQREFFTVENTFRKGSLSVTSFPLNHPQGAFGYRIESEGRAVVIATDFEHGNEKLDKTLREYAEGADVLVYDAQYTPLEYEARQGWGHSSYIEAASVARDAGVGQLILFHHDPAHSDRAINNIVAAAQALFENTTAARELDRIAV